MKKLVLIFIILSALFCTCIAQRVSLQYDKSSRQASYAADVLKLSLLKNGYILNEAQPDFSIALSLDVSGLGKEAYTLSLEGKRITIKGGDDTGLIYGGLSLAEDLRNGILLPQIKKKEARLRSWLSAVLSLIFPGILTGIVTPLISISKYVVTPTIGKPFST